MFAAGELKCGFYMCIAEVFMFWWIVFSVFYYPSFFSSKLFQFFAMMGKFIQMLQYLAYWTEQKLGGSEDRNLSLKQFLSSGGYSCNIKNTHMKFIDSLIRLVLEWTFYLIGLLGILFRGIYGERDLVYLQLTILITPYHSVLVTVWRC